MRRLLAVLIALPLLACTPDHTGQPKAVQPCLAELSQLDAQVQVILTDERKSGSTLTKDTTTAEKIGRLAGFWSRLELLRNKLAEHPMPRECYPLREQYIEALECYQRHFELAIAYAATDNQDYWLRAEDARRAGDRLRRLLFDQLGNATGLSLGPSQG